MKREPAGHPGATTLSRRRVIAAPLAAGAAAMTACGSAAGREAAGSAAGPAKERKPVEVWFLATADDDPWGSTVTRLVNEFDQANRDYKPTITRVPSIGQKVAPSVAAGVGPDALRQGTPEMQSYPMQGIVQPLDGLIKGDKTFQPDDVYPAVKDLSTYQGKTYAVSETMIPQGFFVNRDRVKQAGGDPDRLPATLQDLDQVVPPFFEKDANGYRKIGWVPWIPVASPIHHLAAAGAEWYDLKTAKVTANSPACVQVLEWLKSYAGRYGADQIADFIARNSANNWGRWSNNSPMYDGSMAIFNNGLWLYGSIKQYAPQVNFQLMSLPLWKGASNGRAGVLNANFWYITAPATNPAGGWEMLKWMTARKESVLALATLDTLVPSRKSIAGAKEYLDFAPWTKLFAEQVVPKVKPDYIFASAGLLNTQLTSALTAVYQGKTGTKEALDEVVRVVQNDVDAKQRK